MSIVRSVTVNFSALMVAQVITFALATILRIFLGRYLGDVGFGKLSFAISFASMAMVLAGLGQEPYLTKEVARDRNSAGIMVTNAAVVRIISVALVFLALIVAMPYLPQDGETKTLLYFITFAIAIGSFTSIMTSSVFRAYEKLALSSIGSVAEKTIITFASVFLLLSGFNLVAIGTLYVVGAAANFLLSLFLLTRVTKLKFSLKIDFCKNIFYGGLPFFVFAIFGTIYQRIDQTMLSFMTHDAVVGWYSVAFGLYETLSFLPSTFQLILYPILSRLHVTSQRSFIATTSKAFALFSIMAMPISLGTFVLSPQIIALLFPLESFANSIILLRILAIGLILLFYNILFGTTLMAMDRQKQWSMAAIAGAIINPTINFFLIPYFQNTSGNGAIGAALATEAVEAMLLGVALYLMPRGVITRQNLFIAFRAFIAAGTMAGVIWTLQDNNVFVLVGLGAIVYLAISMALRTITSREIGIVWAAVVKRDTSSLIETDSDVHDELAVY